MKNYIKINLNKAESSEVVKERVLERTRWVVFGVLIFSLLFINVRVWMIGFGYNSVIQKKKDQIKDLENQITKTKTKLEETFPFIKDMEESINKKSEEVKEFDNSSVFTTVAFEKGTLGFEGNQIYYRSLIDYTGTDISCFDSENASSINSTTC